MRDFVFDEFPAFGRVKGGILEIEVDHLAKFLLVAGNSSCTGIPETAMVQVRQIHWRIKPVSSDFMVLHRMHRHPPKKAARLWMALKP